MKYSKQTIPAFNTKEIILFRLNDPSVSGNLKANRAATTTTLTLTSTGTFMTNQDKPVSQKKL